MLLGARTPEMTSGWMDSWAKTRRRRDPSLGSEDRKGGMPLDAHEFYTEKHPPGARRRRSKKEELDARVDASDEYYDRLWETGEIEPTVGYDHYLQGKGYCVRETLESDCIYLYGGDYRPWTRKKPRKKKFWKLPE